VGRGPVFRDKIVWLLSSLVVAYDEVLSISLDIQFRGTGFMPRSQWAVEHVPCAANRIPREFGVLDIHKDGLAFRPMRGC